MSATCSRTLPRCVDSGSRYPRGLIPRCSSAASGLCLVVIPLPDDTTPRKCYASAPPPSCLCPGQKVLIVAKTSSRTRIP